jgi:hypothetical protein
VARESNPWKKRKRRRKKKKKKKITYIIAENNL